MKKLLSKLKNDVRGNILLIGAVGSAALVGGAGLGVDTVQWYLWQRQLQQAVDAGALAGALAHYRGQDYTAAATNAIDLNSNTTVTIDRISDPPQTGAYAGKNGAIEVVGQTQQKLPFSSLFLRTAPVISARAVASTVQGGDNCVISLAPTGTGVKVSGNAQVNLACGVTANSGGSQAIYLSGTSYLNANPLSTVGGIYYTPTNIPSNTTLLTYGLPQTDPMASRGLTVPTSPANCIANNLTVKPSDTVNLVPGRYCGGLNIRGTAYLAPGVYIIDGGSLTINAQATVVGDGVTFVLTGNSANQIAQANIAGGANMDLRAPTSAEDATWHDVLIYQDPRATGLNSTLAGGSGAKFDGIVYMPGADVSFAGNSAQQAQCLLLIANTVDFTGDSNIQNNCPSTVTNLDLSTNKIRVVE